ncbi:MAG TPA: EAL domain-containing response regulator [Polyangia bacterium]|nr:EAL domain-containing response regulator [Polyangia bacterium]
MASVPPSVWQQATVQRVEEVEPPGRVLLVDDEPLILTAFQRVLGASGYAIETAHDGASALALLQSGPFDVIISDISMPGMSGVELLGAVREHDLDVPVILMTGLPAVETAIKAVEYGALRYLLKPVDVTELRRVVEQAVQLHQIAKLKREAVSLLGPLGKLVGDRAGLERILSRGLRSLWMAFQPIVAWPERRIFGYEALLRSSEPALPQPGALLEAAERLGRLPELGRSIREQVAAQASRTEPDAFLFVNLHPRDLLDDALYQHSEPLTRLAHRVVLEITERASLDEIADARTRVQALRKLGFRIAVDDLGAGYAGLTSFAQLEPDVVKLDLALIRDVDHEPTKQRLVRSLAGLCKDMGMLVLAEGVETAAERDMLAELGCELQQGFLFAKPAPPFPDVTW